MLCGPPRMTSVPGRAFFTSAARARSREIVAVVVSKNTAEGVSSVILASRRSTGRSRATQSQTVTAKPSRSSQAAA